jgi:hypothetical protein
MTTNFIDTEKLADSIETAVVAEFEKRFADVSGTDQGLQALYISDAADMLEVCRLIKQSEFSEARAKLYHMDTSPREDLYMLMERVAGSEIVDSMF